MSRCELPPYISAPSSPSDFVALQSVIEVVGQHPLVICGMASRANARLERVGGHAFFARADLPLFLDPRHLSRLNPDAIPAPLAEDAVSGYLRIGFEEVSPVLSYRGIFPVVTPGGRGYHYSQLRDLKARFEAESALPVADVDWLTLADTLSILRPLGARSYHLSNDFYVPEPGDDKLPKEAVRARVGAIGHCVALGVRSAQRKTSRLPWAKEALYFAGIDLWARTGQVLTATHRDLYTATFNEAFPTQSA